MKFGIVYSKNTGRIRSMVVPENEKEQHILGLVKLLNGEAFVKMDMKEFDMVDIVQEKLNKITGIIPKDDRFVILNSKNEVEGVIIADKKIDNLSAKTIKNQDANIGWKYNKGKFEIPDKKIIK